jgi:hypothetical protein
MATSTAIERVSRLPEPVDRLVESVNRGDRAAFLGCLVPDGVVEDDGRRYGSRRAIRVWSDRAFFRAHGRMVVTLVERAANVVRFTAGWVSQADARRTRIDCVLDGAKVRAIRVEGV